MFIAYIYTIQLQLAKKNTWSGYIFKFLKYYPVYHPWCLLCGEFTWTKNVNLLIECIALTKWTVTQLTFFFYFFVIAEIFCCCSLKCWGSFFLAVFCFSCYSWYQKPQSTALWLEVWILLSHSTGYFLVWNINVKQ